MNLRVSESGNSSPELKTQGFSCRFSINLSLGSNAKDQLKRFNRPDVRKAFMRALLLAEHHHMQSVSYIIAGAPGQDSLESLSDLIFLAEMPTLAGMSIFYPAPGSLDYQVCREKNLLPDSFLMMRSTALPISHTTTRRESITLLRLSRIVNFMKFLVDTKIPIPGPEPWTKHCPLDAGDRIKTGKSLLSGFLFDGNIRGITRDNQVFIHLQDKDLTRIFIEKIKQTRIKGTIV
ncbi:MAG: hypothetical protein U9P10_14130 [Thermodesulfobacteriota bacterium]|nr:hypothetical protein [Thermodesulfobacteriota bacterium]